MLTALLAKCYYLRMKKPAKINTAKIKRAFRDIDRWELARKLKTSVRAVDQIVGGLIIVSPKRALMTERITGIPANILRPDIFTGRGC